MCPVRRSSSRLIVTGAEDELGLETGPALAAALPSGLDFDRRLWCSRAVVSSFRSPGRV